MATRTALFFEVFAIDKTQRSFLQIMRSTDSLGSKLTAVGKVAAVGAAAGLAVFAAKGVKSFLAFDDKMTQSLAIMGEVSGPMRQRMENAARQVGKTTRFGAEQAAEAYFFLASAGLDAQQSISAMPQVAKFATAGMFDLAKATDLATDAQSALGLTVQDPEENLRNLTRVTDVLVGANTLANASVEQFATSLTNRAGPALRAVNKPIEEGVAVLAAFADQGIKSEQAGTQLAIVMRDLQTRALGNADAFEDANVAVFDAQGKMNNLGDIIAQLERRLGGMSDAQKRAELATLGFTDKSISALLALLGMSDQIKQYEQDLRGMAGVTEEVAGKQLTSFAARWDMLKSKISDFGISAGKVLVTTAAVAGETIGEMSRMFREDLPPAAQISIGAVAGIVTAAPIAIAAWKKIKATVDAARTSFMAMSAAGRAATLSLGAAGLALAAGAAILAFFATRNLEAQRQVDELRDSLDRQTGAVTDNTRAVAAKKLQDEGLFEAAKKLGISLETLTDAYLGDADAIEQIRIQTQGLHSDQTSLGSVFDREGRRMNTAIRQVNEAIEDGNEVTSRAQSEHQDMAEAVGEGEGEQGELEAQLDATSGAIEQQVDELDELIKSLDDMVTAAFGARDAQRGYEEALDNARDALKDNGATLDINTEKGRNNQEMLDRLARAALDDAAATLEDAEAKGDLAAGHDRATEKMGQAREAFVKVATQMGLSTEKAEALADELGLIPGNYEANVSADVGAARRDVSDLMLWINRQHGTVTVSSRRAITGGDIIARQHGGLARAGQLAMVGEGGPELVRFGESARVFSAPDTSRILHGDEASGPRQVIENVNVTSMTQRFSTKQVLDDLALHGAS